MKIKIFYSWQATTERRYNRSFIATCIDKAVKKLKRKPDFKDIDFEILDGVRGEPGSPAVASKIIDDRIPSSDIFIADLSVVNNISIIQKKVRSIIGDKFKPYQNNNVINEHGVAVNAIGIERIIGILNTEYGSPHENPENIPFDLRHLSFPIEYKYSKKTKNRNEVQDKLVSLLSSALRDTTLFALQSQRDKHKPLITWEEWEEITPLTQKFRTNKKIQEISSQIVDTVAKSGNSIRLIGLSGLGKTRILLETFRFNNEVEGSRLLSSRVLYLNCNHNQTANYQSIFSKIANTDDDRIVILDNCSQDLHRQVLQYCNNKISLITIDSNPEEIKLDKINQVNYLTINKDDLSSIVNEILDEDFSILGKEKVEKIKEFSQGIPLMAVLIGDSLKNGEKFIGRLDDKKLLNKLLGTKGADAESRKILLSCSMFHYFGFEEELRPQLEFIATNKDITSLNGEEQVLINTFDEVCDHYLKREIFERRGRFLSMRPFPLSMSLAQEWLELCNPERLVRVITSIANLQEPHRKNLSEALAEQMKFLGYNDKALQIIDNIVGPNCPFDNAEVLNTELGSRLFRSFVEVNPVAISNNLTRLYSLKSKDELLSIKEGRRNLVWVLEKLCFDKRTFSDSIKVLYSFAVAENETWSNNATGQLIQLFNIQLAGTEVDLGERWKIIEWGLNRKDKEYKKLAFRAMATGLSFGHATRMIGAEVQGSKRLVDYVPTNKAVVEYWNNILSKLFDFITNKDESADLASDTIANSVRSICRARLADVILPFIEKVIEVKDNDWDSGLNSLKQVRKYDKGFLTESQQELINKMISSLTKTDFLSRYLTLSKAYHLEEDESYSSDKVIASLEKLANEFIESKLSWEKYFPVFYEHQQVYSYSFGKRFYELIKEEDEKIVDFLNFSVKTIISIEKEKRNIIVLGGFINESTKEIKENFYDKLNNSELDYLLFYFISINPEGKDYFETLFTLVDNKRCNVSDFRTISHGRALENMLLSELELFSKKMFKYGEDGYAIIFDLFFNLGYHNKELKSSLIPIFEECIIKLGMNKKHIGQLDGYRWTQIVCLILGDSSKVEFARFINNSIIGSISFENSYHLDNYVQDIYEVLLKEHFDSIWPELSEALLSKDESYAKFYGLKHILGSHIGGVGRSIGVLFVGNIDMIFEWCKANCPLAPSRLAELVPIFNNDNQEYSEWHPIALRLIAEYGHYEDVLSNLGSNMGTFSWTGSLVPFLESKKELFSTIKNHSVNEVSIWANKYLQYLDEDIKRERIRDEEMYL